MGFRGVVVALSVLPWIVLGPLNIFKVAHLNRGSPIAKYIVVPPAETCQSACNIARMWACLFWGLQTGLAVAIVTRSIAPKAAALCKAYVGVALVVAYHNDVVREPVALAGGLELLVALLLATAPVDWPGAAELGAGLLSVVELIRSIATRYGMVFIVVHWATVALTIGAFWVLLGGGSTDLVALAARVPFAGEMIAQKLQSIDPTTGGARFAVAWVCAAATAPLRMVTDAIFTVGIGEFLAARRPTKDKDKEA